MHGRVDADDMPRLDAFDEEFGREPVAILRGQRRRSRLRLWSVVVFVLAAGIVGALAFAWPTVDGGLLPHLQLPQLQSMPFSTKSTGGADEQVDRLRREVAALKRDVRELTEAQQQAADTIAALKAAEQEHSGSSVSWYSDPAALNFGIVSQQPQPGVIAPPLRPAATARPKARKRDVVTPLSLEAPQ